MWNVHIRKKLKGRQFFYNCLQISVNHIDRMSDSGLTCSLLLGEENGRHLREYYLFSAKIDMEELKIIGWCHYPHICVQIYIGTVLLNIPPPILHRTVWSFHTYTQRVMRGLIMGGNVFPVSLLKAMHIELHCRLSW